jgi:hypothetical protein
MKEALHKILRNKLYGSIIIVLVGWFLYEHLLVGKPAQDACSTAPTSVQCANLRSEAVDRQNQIRQHALAQGVVNTAKAACGDDGCANH